MTLERMMDIINSPTPPGWHETLRRISDFNGRELQSIKVDHVLDTLKEAADLRELMKRGFEMRQR